MKKSLALAFVLVALLLTGCTGTTVIYQEITRPDTSQPTPPPENSGPAALKTGLALITDTTTSQNGLASYDVTVAAVLVDDEGVIRACMLDGAAAQIPFDESGVLTESGSSVTVYREENGVWVNRAQVLERAAVGKTLRQLRTAGDWDERLLAAVEQAVANAAYLGAGEADELRLAVLADLSDSTSAAGEETGRGRLSCDVAALTLSGETITSCTIDSVQADVTFDAAGVLSGELSDRVPTKTELGDAYGMKAYGGAKYEWYEQAANFSAYATGKTAAQVMAIPTADGKPTQADLYTSVTISITPFQRLIARACGLG